MRVVRVWTISTLLPLWAGAALGQISDGYSTTHSGVRIHYLMAGRETASPTLVLIPGWRLPASLWSEQLRQFAPTTRVIAIDPRSQGESTKMTDGNTPEVRAQDLHDVLLDLDVSRCVLVGWSQGAQDVSAYVQQFGTDNVVGIVLVDSPVSAGPAEAKLHPAFTESILGAIASYAGAPRGFSEGMVRSIFKKPHPDLDMAKLVDATLRTPTNTGVAMLATDIFGADRRPALAKWTRPSLVIAASESPLLDVQREMAATMPGATFVVVDGVGHAVMVDAPDRFDALIRTFLAKATVAP